MLKQSSSRNLRSKGFKVKHFIQVIMLLVIGVWLVNQLKHSYDKKAAYDNSTGKISEDVQSDNELVVKLGRKGLHPRVGGKGLEIENQGGRAELEDEVEEIKPGEIEDEGKGGGDDEIDGHGQDRTEEEESEEVEDLIDVDDREREERNEDQEIEEKGDQLEDASSLDGQTQNQGERDLQESREEHYKGDDVSSSSVMQDSLSIITQLGIGGLRKTKEISEVYNAEDMKLEQGYKSHGDEEFTVHTVWAGQYGNDEKSGDSYLDNINVNSDSTSVIADPIDRGFGIATASHSIIPERIMKIDANVVGKL